MKISIEVSPEELKSVGRFFKRAVGSVLEAIGEGFRQHYLEDSGTDILSVLGAIGQYYTSPQGDGKEGEKDTRRNS